MVSFLVSFRLFHFIWKYIWLRRKGLLKIRLPSLSFRSCKRAPEACCLTKVLRITSISNSNRRWRYNASFPEASSGLKLQCSALRSGRILNQAFFNNVLSKNSLPTTVTHSLCSVSQACSTSLRNPDQYLIGMSDPSACSCWRAVCISRSQALMSRVWVPVDLRRESMDSVISFCGSICRASSSSLTSYSKWVGGAFRNFLFSGSPIRAKLKKNAKWRCTRPGPIVVL